MDININLVTLGISATVFNINQNLIFTRENHRKFELWEALALV